MGSSNGKEESENDVETMRRYQQQQMDLKGVSALTASELQQIGSNLAGNTDGMASANFDGFLVSSEHMLTLGVCFKTQTLPAIANLCKTMFASTLYTIYDPQKRHKICEQRFCDFCCAKGVPLWQNHTKGNKCKKICRLKNPNLLSYSETIKNQEKYWGQCISP